MKLFKLKNSKGTELSVLDFGGTWQSLKIGGVDILSGFDNFDDYKSDQNPYFGATIGRFSNRIGGGSFEIDGVKYEISKNKGKDSLHGGKIGFDKKIWNAQLVNDDGQEKLRLSYLSKDGEEGFPGNLDVTIDYYVTEHDEVVMDEFALTDKTTFCNLTNHAYFNLCGHNSGDISRHKIQIFADKLLEIDSDLIPTGKLLDAVGGLDLRNGRMMDSFDGDDLVKRTNGYDFCYIPNGKGYRLIAKVFTENLDMEVYTDKTTVQLYTGNFLDNLKGKDNAVYDLHNAFCLETGGYPDCPNKPNFPSSLLKKGEIYRHKTVYKFCKK